MLPERIRSIRCPPEGEYAALQGKPRGPIRPLPERIGKGVGHAGSQPPRGCLYGAWVLPFTPIHRGQPQCLRQRHSRSPPRRQLGSPLLRHMPRLRPRRRFPQRLRKRDGDRQNRRPRGLRFRCGYGVWECVCKRFVIQHIMDNKIIWLCHNKWLIFDEK